LTDDFSEQEKMGLYKAIYSRRDVRSHFNSKPINDDILSRILHAAHHAPFDIEKNRSSQLVEEPKRSKYLSFKLEGILESPVNLCVTYDPTKFGPFVIGRSSIPEAGLYSVCCAIQNLWLSARTEGIGLGWVSILSNDALKEVLEIPEHVIPVAYLCLGHVDDFAEKPDLQTAGWLPRLELKDVVYFEKWDDKENNEWESIQKMIKENLDYA